MKAKASLLLLTYNQESVVEIAARACLDQDWEPLEIIFSDDASTDGTFAILKEIARTYDGPHTIIIRRNARNVGIGPHYNEAIAASSGDMVITAAGDDISEPHRVSQLMRAWDAAGRKPDLISSHFVLVNDQGCLRNRIHTDDLRKATLATWSKGHPFTVGATHAFTRRLFDEYGPLATAVWYEDPVFLLRALMSGGAITVPEPLVRYRIGGTSQQPAFASAFDLKKWYGTQSQRILAGIAQMLDDASKKGHYSFVYDVLCKQKSCEEYIHSMISESSLIGRYRVFRERKDIKTSWKVRKLLTFSFPGIAVLFKQIKSKIRRSRKYIGDVDISDINAAS